MTDKDSQIPHDGDPTQPDELASTLPIPPKADQPRRIGPFHILELLGTGGMGEVYLAEQKTPIKRRVALKLIKVGMDTKEVVARFESERQALAMMNHPNVAKIYDAGSTDAGRPYFVMEHVPGEPITDYCDRHRLDIENRLELFIPVCQAIHHAHQKGIIHRDIKPSNVLVAVEDGKPVPKVIDFGVAKATQQSLTEKTIYTQQGRMIGTPAYMSPEQAEMTGSNLDTTSDVYSLGVMLYELLVGAQPFDANELRAAGIAEIHRIIREVDPPKPSTKISSLGERATDTAAKRRTGPRRWKKQLNGELDWITMRAMEKDRTRRYPSASEFAADVRHYLRNEPVVASPGSVLYLTKKFVKRYRRALHVAAYVMFALVIGLTATFAMYRRAEFARRDASWQSYLANIQFAAASLSSFDLDNASEALERCPIEYRDWEWRHLSGLLDSSEGAVEVGKSGITALALGPGREKLAVGFDSGIVLYRNVDSMSSAGRTIEGPGGRVDYVKIDPSGARMAVSYSSSSDMYLISLPGGEVLAKIPVGGWPVDFEFHPNNGRLYVADGKIRSYEVDGGASSRVDPLRGIATRNFCFIDNGRELVAVVGLGDVQVVDVSSGVVKKTLSGVSGQHGNLSRPIVGSPDGKKVAIVRGYYSTSKRDTTTPPGVYTHRAGPRISVWQPEDNESLEFQREVSFDVASMEFSPNGLALITGHSDGTIRVWSSVYGDLLQTRLGHTRPVKAIVPGPGLQEFTSGSFAGQLRTWDLHGNKTFRSVGSYSGFPGDLCGGEALGYLCIADGIILGISNLESGNMSSCRFEKGIEVGRGFRSVTISREGELVALSTPMRGVGFFGHEALQDTIEAEFQRVRVEDGKPIERWSVSLPRSDYYALLADGDRVVSAHVDGRVEQATDSDFDSKLRLQINDVRSGETEQLVEWPSAGDTVSALCVAEAGRFVCIGRTSGALTIYDVERRRTISAMIDLGSRIDGIGVNARCGMMIVGLRSGEAVILDVLEGNILSKIAGQLGPVSGVALNNAGSRAYVSGWGGGLNVFDVETSDRVTSIEVDSEAFGKSHLLFEYESETVFASIGGQVYQLGAPVFEVSQPH